MLKILAFFIVFLPCWLFSGEIQAQDPIRKIDSQLRKVRNRYNRTKRSVNRAKKALASQKKTVDANNDSTDIIQWQKGSFIPNSGMIYDYDYIFSFLHKEETLTFSKDPATKFILWDSLNNEFYKNSANSQVLKDGVEVMGWHPYWMEDAYQYYNYDLLSIISYYSYDINPETGLAWEQEIIDGLFKSALLDSADSSGTRVFISVTSYTEENNRQFLSNKQAQYDFGENIIGLLNKRKGVLAGVDLDFEEIREADREIFTQFVITLSTKLKNAGFSLILDVPFFDQRGVYDYKALKDHVEYFNVMGYDFHGEYSDYPGSIAPLRSLENKPSLETAVNDLLIAEVPGQQIILTLPLYGVTWDISNLDRGKSAVFDASIPYYDILAEYDNRYNPFYDPLAASMFYLTEENRVRKMCWFENETTFDLKFKWMMEEKGLKGAGVWALGYARGDNKIWKAIEKNFCKDSLELVTPIAVTYSGPYGITKSIVKQKKAIGATFLIFAGFFVLGLLLSLRDWRVREILFKQQSFRMIYSIAFVVFAVLALKWLQLDATKWTYVLLPVGTAAALYLINLLFTSYRKRLK